MEIGEKVVVVPPGVSTSTISEPDLAVVVPLIETPKDNPPLWLSFGQVKLFGPTIVPTLGVKLIFVPAGIG